MDEQNIKRDYLSLISKINDRNIQQQRESGITIYTLIAAILLLGNVILSDINKLFDDKIVNIIDFLALSINISHSLITLAIATIVGRAQISKSTYKIRILPDDFFQIGLIIRALFGITFLLINYYAIVNVEHSNYSTFVFYFACSFYTLDILAQIFGIIYKNKQELETNIEFSGVSLGKSVGFFVKYTVMLFPIGLFIFYSYHLLNYGFQLSNKDYFIIFKLGFIYCLISAIAHKLIELIGKAHENKDLEDFEKRIFFENLSNEQIKFNFQLLFEGFPIEKIMEVNNKSVSSFWNDIELKILNIESQITDLEDIDSIYPIEIKGRKEEVKNQTEQLKNLILSEEIKWDKLVKNTNGMFTPFAEVDKNKYQEFFKEFQKRKNETFPKIDDLFAKIK